MNREPYRILAAETLAYWHERIMDIKGADMPVLAMGDFNDEPFSRSLTEYALSTTQAAKLLNARSPRFFT
jgi:endonuclease/exonuclease/phosphatase family metal-dependent hydrolase